MDKLFKQINSEQRQAIAKRLHNLSSVEEFYELLYSVVGMLKLPESNIILYREITKKYWENDIEIQYKNFVIKKKSGKSRTISAPRGYLKLFQRLVNVILSSVFDSHPNSFGYDRGSSICTNAERHIAKEFVFNIDMKDFFPSINAIRVHDALSRPPFNLNGSRQLIASNLSYLCTMPFDESNADDVRILPQGAPTSPLLSNAVCVQMDRLLTVLAEEHSAVYSRYADDITFSAGLNIFKSTSPFRVELEHIINGQGFTINTLKTRIQGSGSRQIVTGLVVNEKLNVRRRFIKKLRMYLSFWEKYGYSKAEKYLFKDEKIQIDDFTYASLYTILKGRLNYLKMVKGPLDSTYLKLIRRFIKLESEYLPSRKRTPLANKESFNKHNPQAVSRFLRYFNDSNALKYLTHDFDIPDHEFNFGVIMEQAHHEFNKAYEQFAITFRLYARVKQFAFESNPNWWRWQNGKKVNYNIGWGSKQVQDWSKENPGIHPIRLKRFRDTLICPFKESIQFRPPGLRTAMQQTIREKFDYEFDNLNVEYVNLESAEFSTDVDIFLGGVRHLLDGILERMDISKRIRIRFSKQLINGKDMKVLEITHIGSTCFKLASSKELLNGNFLEAKKMIFGLCNWSIAGRFSDGCFRVTMLSDDPNLPEKQSIEEESVDGFTHILYFY